MRNLVWSNQVGSRGRCAWLLFIKGDEIISFTGRDIPGVVVVCDTTYKEVGKWSHTTYYLQLADGVCEVVGYAMAGKPAGS